MQVNNQYATRYAIISARTFSSLDLLLPDSSMVVKVVYYEKVGSMALWCSLPMYVLNQDAQLLVFPSLRYPCESSHSLD